MSQEKVLDVRLNGVRLGQLEQTSAGKMNFAYVSHHAETMVAQARTGPKNS